MKHNLINKKFGVLGLGIANKSVLDFFIRNNYKFITWDDNSHHLNKLAEEISNRDGINIKDYIEKPDNPKWQNIDYLIMAPGIPLTHPSPHKIVTSLQKTKTKIICDIELFYLLYPNNTYVGITGTNGKSTITSLTHHMTNNSVIAGNIGKPIFELVETENQIIILEISSFQIDLLDKIRFSIAALSNITPDHIDRHDSFENYTNIKYQLISKFNKGISIITIDSPITKKLYLKLRETKQKVIPISTKKTLKHGISLTNKTIEDNINNKIIPVPKNNSLTGKHNDENTIISYAISSSITHILPSEVQDSISSFKGLKHRMQFITEYKNIAFINDSKGTNAISTKHALESYKAIFWILGGVAKEGGIKPLIPLFHNVKHAFTIGEAKQEFAETLEEYNVPFSLNGNLTEAFREATDLAINEQEKVVILLSPACASFDQWKNFAERGDAFIKLVDDFIQSNAND